MCMSILLKDPRRRSGFLARAIYPHRVSLPSAPRLECHRALRRWLRRISGLIVASSPGSVWLSHMSGYRHALLPQPASGGPHSVQPGYSLTLAILADPTCGLLPSGATAPPEREVSYEDTCTNAERRSVLFWAVDPIRCGISAALRPPGQAADDVPLPVGTGRHAKTAWRSR